MTRIVHYTDTTAFGGAEQMLLTLLEGLPRDRWGCVLLYHPCRGIEPLVQGARSAGARTVSVDGPAESSRRAVRAIISALRREQPSVFHAHLTWDLRCSPGLVAAFLAGVRRRVASQQLFVRPRGRRRRVRQRLVSMLVDRYIAVSHAMAADLRAAVLRPRTVSVVHNAVDADRFDSTRAAALRRSLAGHENGPLVLTVARLDAQKGLSNLIAAAAQVPGARFVVAGEGTDRAALERQASDAGIAGRFQLLGHRADIPALLAACDVFVLPSIFEGLPVSVLEAMAARKPIVASNVHGIDEAVLDGTTGLLVPAADPIALAGAIRRLLSDSRLAGRLAVAARIHVDRHFSARGMVGRIEAVYDELLGSSSYLTVPQRIVSAAAGALTR